MTKPALRLMLLVATAGLIVIGTLVVFGSVKHNRPARMMNVGGSTNQCNCTERIER